MIRNKLKSRRGASITFALFLFLVCAVISAVVIVAGTAAAGRLKDLPESDQRYYAVSSAAELLRTAMDGQSVSLVRTKAFTTTTKYKRADGAIEAGYPSNSAADIKTAIYAGEVTSRPAEGADFSLLTQLANKLETRNESGAQTETFPAYAKMTLTAAASGGSPAVAQPELLGVELYQQLEANGTLMIYVRRPRENVGEYKKGDAYTLRLTFAADRQENTSTSVISSAPVLDDTYYTTSDDKTETTTTVYTWKLIDIAKVPVPDTTFGLT